MVSSLPLGTMQEDVVVKAGDEEAFNGFHKGVLKVKWYEMIIFLAICDVSLHLCKMMSEECLFGMIYYFQVLARAIHYDVLNV